MTIINGQLLPTPPGPVPGTLSPEATAHREAAEVGSAQALVILQELLTNHPARDVMPALQQFAKSLKALIEVTQVVIDGEDIPF